MALGFGGVGSCGGAVCGLEADLAEVGTDCTPEAQRVEIQARVFDKAAAAFMKYRKDPPCPLAPRVFIPPKLTEDFGWQAKVLGIYYPHQTTVRLNMVVLCDAESYENTLAHEVAHHVQFQALLTRFCRLENIPRREAEHHGFGWRQVMRHMGYEPEVKGEADLSMAYPKAYAGMTCSCGIKHSIGRRRLKNVAARSGHFVCKCGLRLEPADFKGHKE